MEDLPVEIGDLQIQVGTVSADRDGKKARVTLTILSKEEAEKPVYERDMTPDRLYNLGRTGIHVTTNDIGVKLTLQGEEVEFLGRVKKNRKYPWIVGVRGKKAYKITDEVLAHLLTESRLEKAYGKED